LGIIGLATAHLEIEEGKVAFSIKKLQNISKHHLFHLEDRVRYKCELCDSALDQVRVELGSELDPGKVSILILLG
jgi:transposase-like protein